MITEQQNEAIVHEQALVGEFNKEIIEAQNKLTKRFERKVDEALIKLIRAMGHPVTHKNFESDYRSKLRVNWTSADVVEFYWEKQLKPLLVVDRTKAFKFHDSGRVTITIQ